MGKTRRDAQQQAAELALHNLAGAFILGCFSCCTCYYKNYFICFKTGSMHLGFNMIGQK